MSKNSIGMAVRITKDNHQKLSIVNGGVVPRISENPNEELVYFYFPYHYDSSCEILLKSEFDKRFEFGNTERTDQFVDVTPK